MSRFSPKRIRIARPQRISIAPPHVLRCFDIRRLVVPRVDARGRILQGFESLHAATRELRHRFRSLTTSDLARTEATQALARHLQGCGYLKLGRSLACPRCVRTQRIERAAEVLRLIAAYPSDEALFVTLINPSDALRLGELSKLAPRKLTIRLRRQLERAGLNSAASVLIGALDGEWDAGWSLFQPHWHFLVVGVSKTELKKVLTCLVAKWPQARNRVRVRARVENTDDIPRSAAYLDKSWWPMVARKKNPEGIHPHGKRRPPPHIEREILTWLHAHQAAELRMHIGVKTYHGKLVKD